MKFKVLVCTIASMFILGSGFAFAYENITAKEASNMANRGKAILIDVRTLEEIYWVGMPFVAEGGLYVIPWQTKAISADGTVQTEVNPDFEGLVEQVFGSDKNQALITMCRSGGRSTAAANFLESIGFTNVYEIDNILKDAANGTGGRGGFQGTSYDNYYDGYRGYPSRLPSQSYRGHYRKYSRNQNKLTVETRTHLIKNPESSVAWLDTGLPVTQNMDDAIIPVLE